MVIRVTPSDGEKMQDYESRTLSVVEQFGGRPIARDEDPLVLETDHKPAIAVVLEFPSKAEVKAFYESEAYAPLKEFRHTFADAEALVIDGL
jgi:uncharacterized protein (DUF1330 family)